jgi:hypothetical protein
MDSWGKRQEREVRYETSADQQPSTVEDLLDYGATLAATAKTSAHIVMMEGKVEELVARVGDHLKDADLRTVKSVEKVLNEFEKDLVKFLSAREAVSQTSVIRRPVSRTSFQRGCRLTQPSRSGISYSPRRT